MYQSAVLQLKGLQQYGGSSICMHFLLHILSCNEKCDLSFGDRSSHLRAIVTMVSQHMELPVCKFDVIKRQFLEFFTQIAGKCSCLFIAAAPSIIFRTILENLKIHDSRCLNIPKQTIHII